MANNNKRRRKPKGNYRKDSRKPQTRGNAKKEMSDEEILTDGRTHNDMTWWMKLGQLSKDAANISYGNAIGAPLEPFEVSRSTIVANRDHKFTAAGVMAIDYTPCLGDIDSVTHPINEAARIIYDFVNAKNSRNPSYDPSDIMTYILATSGPYMLYSYVKRIVGLYASFNVMNKYWPTTVLRALNVAAIDTQHDIITWRNLANRMAIKLNMFCIPDNIDYFDHVMSMNESVYMDSSNMKASLFVLNPTAVWRWNDPDEHHDAAWIDLARIGVSGAANSPTLIESLFNSLMQRLLNNTDITMMSADILKAYGMEKLMRLSAVDETYTVVPEMNMEFITRLNNAVVYEGMAASLHSKYRIVQNMDYNILQTEYEFVNYPTIRANLHFLNSMVTDYVPINLPTSDVSPELTTNAVLWKTLPVVTAGHRSIDCVCEVLTGTRVFKYVFNPTDQMWEVEEYDNMSIVTNDSLSNLRDEFNRISMYSKFRGAPLQMEFECTGGTAASPYTSLAYSRCLSDLENFTTVDEATVRNIHRVALTSIFYPVDAKPVG